MNEDGKLGLSSMISIVVGVISLIVVIPTIALIMNKTKPTENVAIMHFDRDDEDYFISIGAIYTLHSDSNNPSMVLPGYDFNSTSDINYVYEFNYPYYVVTSAWSSLVDRVVNLADDETEFSYDGNSVGVGISGVFVIYGLSNY